MALRGVAAKEGAAIALGEVLLAQRPECCLRHRPSAHVGAVALEGAGVAWAPKGEWLVLQAVGSGWVPTLRAELESAWWSHVQPQATPWC